MILHVITGKYQYGGCFARSCRVFWLYFYQVINFCVRRIISTAFVCICTRMLVQMESFTFEQADKSERLEASKAPYTHSQGHLKQAGCVKCTEMCSRGNGCNACPCKNIGQFCSTVCHGREKSCHGRVVDGDASSSEDPTSESFILYSLLSCLSS